MNEVQIEKLKVLRATADNNMSQAGNAIHFRRKSLKVLVKNIKEGKKAISACHRANLSSRAAYWSVFGWGEKATECEEVLKFLRGSLSLASEDRYALDVAISKLTEKS